MSGALRWLPLVLLLAVAPAAAEWFDALLARVGDSPLLASDVTSRERLFGNGAGYLEMPAQEREAALDALIRQRLLLDEAIRFGIARPDAARVAEVMAELRARPDNPGAGMDDATLARQVEAELWTAAFIDARIRAFVMIRDAAVDDVLAVQGGPHPGEITAQARERVRTELAEQETISRLDRYMDRLMRRSEVRRYPPPQVP
ncbi:MAG: hypothetical protein OEW11_04165 [Nitrospirota bacterium]|nr:hypothetical protein [Nitrospirota bacterium]